MNKPQLNLQDAFLNALRKERMPVTVFLINGFQLKGTITGFDTYIILLDSGDGKPQQIFKHAVSTISPLRQVKFFNQDVVGTKVQPGKE